MNIILCSDQNQERKNNYPLILIRVCVTWMTWSDGPISGMPCTQATWEEKDIFLLPSDLGTRPALLTLPGA